MPLATAEREERALWLRLALTSGVGPAVARRLLEDLGLPEDIFASPRARLAKVIDAAPAQALLADDAERDALIERCLDWAGGEHNHLLVLADPGYPQALLTLPDPPPVLFVRGDCECLNRPALAVVGSRHATRGGAGHAHDFARALGAAGWIIVSGLAVGIDAAAHRGALETAAGTIAVVGSGLDKVYPAQHLALAQRIAENGAIISEFALGYPPLRENFPRRNRLIAALSRGVLVVEAARHSGSLITARLAGEMGREVFAIPGSIDSPVTKGCHALIKQGAKLVESADDVLSELGAGPPKPGSAASSASPSPVDAGQTDASADSIDASMLQLIRSLGWDPISGDELVARSAMAAGEIASAMLRLELAGRVERLDDGRYQRVRA